MSISDEEIEHLYRYVHEEAESYERALDLIEHERLDASALSHFNGGYMAEKNSSQITTRSLDCSAIHKREERNVVLKVQGYGYSHRQPSFDVNANSVCLYLSVQEASEMAARLLEHVVSLQDQEKAS
jgi:hypothetical protein